jgi:hypothetical protein
MTTKLTSLNHDFYRIEAEAHRMRAEAFRQMFRALGRVVVGLFAQRGAKRAA